MISKKILANAMEFAYKELGEDSSGHDFWHVRRVAENARRIAIAESADPDICELAAMLHDIPDDKRGLSEEEGVSKLKAWLLQTGIETSIMENILGIIGTMSFRGGNNPSMSTPEGKVVQDADRLDAMGAIGIARTFAYSGHIGQKIYDPDIKVRTSVTREEYRNSPSTAVNHFHEKLFKLESLLNTKTAREMARERQKFMEVYLQQFMKEWNLEECSSVLVKPYGFQVSECNRL